MKVGHLLIMFLIGFCAVPIETINANQNTAQLNLEDFQNTTIKLKLLGGSFRDNPDKIIAKKRQFIYLVPQLYVQNQSKKHEKVYIYILNQNNRPIIMNCCYTGYSLFLAWKIPTSINKGNYTMKIIYKGNCEKKLLPSQKMIALHIY